MKRLAGIGLKAALISLIPMVGFSSRATAQWVAVCSVTQQKPEPGVITEGVYTLTDPDLIYVSWMILGAQTGDAIEANFITVEGSVVEAGGAEVYQNYTIGTTSIEAPDGSDNSGVWGDFSLERPEIGWPVGQYRTEIQLRGQTVTSCPFEIVSTS